MADKNSLREHWSGSFGFVMAAAGLAIGLGNIWKFPYITGENGGGAFVLIYLICIAIIGLPVMLCEMTLGRHTQKNPVGAFRAVSPPSSKTAHLIGFGMLLVGCSLLCFGAYGWAFVMLLIGALIFRFGWTMAGFMGVIAGFVILSFYSVVAGWTIGYMVKSMAGDLHSSPETLSSRQLAELLLDKATTVPADIRKSVQDHIAETVAAGRPPESEEVLMERAGRAQACLYLDDLNKKYKMKLTSTGWNIPKDKFPEYFIKKMEDKISRKDLMDELVKSYGGKQEVAGRKGTWTYPQKLQTTIAGQQFVAFSDNPYYAILFHVVFMVLCVAIVYFGIKNGIEMSSKILMPLLFLLLLALIMRALTLPGATRGISFYLTPDFSKINTNSVLIALGHAFFSLSLGMGAMITYGSYVSKEENIFLSALSVVGLDTLVALMAGLVIFPAVFAMGFAPDKGPVLVFMVLPAVFNQMPAGAFWATLFFLLLLIAALTSGISLLEVVVAYFIDEFKFGRKKTTVVVGAFITVLGVFCAVSVHNWNRLGTIHKILVKLFAITQENLFAVLDNLASNWMLPLGGLLIAIFVGWIWGTRKAVEEIRHGAYNFADVHLIALLAGLKDDPSHNSEYHVLTLASLWGIFIRFITPFAILLAFFHTIGWIKF